MPAIIGLLILIVGLIAGNIALDSKTIQTSPIPTPSVISLPTYPIFLVPTYTPTPTVTNKQIKGISTSTSSLIDCIGPDEKHFKTTETECKKFNDAWGKPVDYIVTCNVSSNCGGGTRSLKKSECDNSTCCQIGDKWYYYPTKTACTQAQNNYNDPSSNYPPCTVYYSALGYSRTYSYISPEECQQAKNNVSSTTTNTYIPPTIVPLPTLVPQPTTDPALCANAVAEWRKYVEDFYQNKYNNYSSSAEAIMALESDRQVIQNQINSYGCINVLRLN